MIQYRPNVRGFRVYGKKNRKKCMSNTDEALGEGEDRSAKLFEVEIASRVVIRNLVKVIREHVESLEFLYKKDSEDCRLSPLLLNPTLETIYDSTKQCTEDSVFAKPLTLSLANTDNDTIEQLTSCGDEYLAYMFLVYMEMSTESIFPPSTVLLVNGDIYNPYESFSIFRYVIEGAMFDPSHTDGEEQQNEYAKALFEDELCKVKATIRETCCVTLDNEWNILKNVPDDYKWHICKAMSGVSVFHPDSYFIEFLICMMTFSFTQQAGFCDVEEDCVSDFAEGFAEDYVNDFAEGFAEDCVSDFAGGCMKDFSEDCVLHAINYYE